MRYLAIGFVLLIFGVTLAAHRTPNSASEPRLTGQWRVNFDLAPNGNKTLTLEVRDAGIGSVLLLDTAVDNKPESSPRPALWSQTTGNRVSFSTEVELPIGTCCRDTGTLILKGKLGPENNTISGKATFITSTIDEENFNGFRTLVGTFSAVRQQKTD